MDKSFLYKIKEVEVDGNVMIWIPKFYIGEVSCHDIYARNDSGVLEAAGKNTYNGSNGISISDTKATGMSPHPAFLVNGKEVDGFYISKYKASLKNGVVSSVKDNNPHYCQKAQAKELAPLAVDGGHIMTWWQYQAILLLFMLCGWKGESVKLTKEIDSGDYTPPESFTLPDFSDASSSQEGAERYFNLLYNQGEKYFPSQCNPSFYKTGSYSNMISPKGIYLADLGASAMEFLGDEISYLYGGLNQDGTTMGRSVWTSWVGGTSKLGGICIHRVTYSYNDGSSKTAIVPIFASQRNSFSFNYGDAQIISQKAGNDYLSVGGAIQSYTLSESVLKRTSSNFTHHFTMTWEEWKCNPANMWTIDNTSNRCFRFSTYENLESGE